MNIDAMIRRIEKKAKKQQEVDSINNNFKLALGYGSADYLRRVKEIIRDLVPKIPKLYETDGQKDKTAWIKLFTPWSSWTWYVYEFDGDDTCFGLVEGHEIKMGNFSLEEILSLKHFSGLQVEFDVWFEPRVLCNGGVK